MPLPFHNAVPPLGFTDAATALPLPNPHGRSGAEIVPKVSIPLLLIFDAFPANGCGAARRAVSPFAKLVMCSQGPPSIRRGRTNTACK